tara:strand:+ start:17866 stop:19170 length:1305 start_codon:yes stop_codon:yes gene_type:complete
MVIENNKGYKSLLKRISGKSVCAVFARDDNRNHPAESKSIAVSIYYEGKTYDIIFDHSESFSSDLDIKLLSSIKRFWVDDVKEFYHITGLCNGYDVRLYNYLETLDYNVLDEPEVFKHIYENTFSLRKANKIIPVVKVLEYCHDRLDEIIKNIPKSITKSYVRYNRALYEFAKLESSGIKIIPNSFGTVFMNGYGYTNYNIFTATGRPSNTFRGVNFGALNKHDNTRNNIVSRFDKGLLVEFDYDAYHLRLLAEILNFDVPMDQSLHQYFADEIYKTTYDESKKISWQILYGNIQVSEKDNPFFYKVEKMADVLYGYFTNNKHFKSHIYKRQFVSDQISDPNKKKVLNYFIQSYETEKNIEIITKINKYLEDRNTRMMLYTYDSFLFDLDRKEGLKTVLQIKEILQDNKYPVKVKAGLNYGSLEEITERLNGLA